MVGMTSIIAKAGILTKIYLPKWTIIVASTLHILISYSLNILVVVFFFAFYRFMPDLIDIFWFVMYSLWVYILIITISLATSPLVVKFKDLSQIWEVALMAGFYSAPIIYPMSAIPKFLHWILHLNPMTFIVQYMQANMFEADFTNRLLPNLMYFGILMVLFMISLWVYRRNIKKVVEYI